MTPRFEIREARPADCGQMARIMRQDTRETLVKFEANPHRDLREFFRQSSFCKAWLIDGKLAALGGVTGTLMASHGVVWLAFSKDATRYPKAIVNEARRQLAYLLDRKLWLETTLLPGDAKATRLAVFLGFNIKHPLPFAAHEVTHVEISRASQARVLRKKAEFHPFLVYTAGRSRTAWLSEFLTYGDARCHNEIAIKFRDMREVVGFFSDHRNGSAETAAAPAWQLIRHFVPGMRTVVVRRDAESIIRSFARSEVAHIAAIDEDKLRRVIAREQRDLDRISSLDGTLTVEFSELEKASICAEVFEHCLPYAFDMGWWERMKDRNAQASVVDIFRYYHENRDVVEEFKRDSKRLLINLVRSGELHAVH